MSKKATPSRVDSFFLQTEFPRADKLLSEKGIENLRALSAEVSMPILAERAENLPARGANGAFMPLEVNTFAEKASYL